MMRAATMLLILVAGCYSPELRDGQFTCASGLCPDGLSCVCGVCRLAPTSVTCGGDDLGTQDLDGVDLSGADLSQSDLLAKPDMALPPPPDMKMPPPPDMPPPQGDMPPAQPCTNGGQRAAADPGLMRVAFCPAAWVVPGINNAAAMTPACTRQPTSNGKDAAQTPCSAEDNCGQGWHVCNDDAEMGARGLTAAHCMGFGGADGIWASRIRGGPPSMGAQPQCGFNSSRGIFGCGMIGMPPSCSIMQKVLFDPPSPGDDCATATGNAWQCPGVSMTVPDGDAVIKPSLAKGGVICCSDQ